MKLRIKGNSVRLRLTQTEVQRIAQGEAVRERTSFGKGLPTFIYALGVGSDASEITVSYREHSLQVTLPARVARQWTDSDQISIEKKLPSDENTSLLLLVEKDFQCLHKRPHEDERDHFPYPAT